MNRFLFLFPILLMGCSQPVYRTTASSQSFNGEEPAKTVPESMSSIGFHDAVDWRCHQADYNENLVWVECVFDNTSATRSNRACIRVILLNAHDTEVARSRLVCSSMMLPGTSYENFAGFQNSRHTRVREMVKEQCGLDTSRCKMTTREYPIEE